MNGSDFNDLAQLSGLDAVKRAIECARPSAEISSKNSSSSSSSWPEPQPLTVKVAPEPYPIDALPKTIRAAVEEASFLGGYVAARLAHRIPTPLLRALVIAYGVGITGYFFWSTYRVA